MRCPSCAAHVPEARFCARCGSRLGTTTPPRPSPQTDAAPRPRRGWAGAALVAGLAIVAAALVGTPRSSGERPAVDDVALPVAAAAPAPAGRLDPRTSAPPFAASPSATVLCSDLSEHRVAYAWLDGAEIGDAVHLHGVPCIVTEIDPDARPRR